MYQLEKSRMSKKVHAHASRVTSLQEQFGPSTHARGSLIVRNGSTCLHPCTIPDAVPLFGRVVLIAIRQISNAAHVSMYKTDAMSY